MALPGMPRHREATLTEAARDRRRATCRSRITCERLGVVDGEGRRRGAARRDQQPQSRHQPRPCRLAARRDAARLPDSRRSRSFRASRRCLTRLARRRACRSRSSASTSTRDQRRRAATGAIVERRDRVGDVGQRVLRAGRVVADRRDRRRVLRRPHVLAFDHRGAKPASASGRRSTTAIPARSTRTCGAPGASAACRARATSTTLSALTPTR